MELLSAVEFLTYVALDKNKEYHSPAISAFKSGAHDFFCNQALIKKQVSPKDIPNIKDYFGQLPYSVWIPKKIDNQKELQALELQFLEEFSLMSTNLHTLPLYTGKDGIEVKKLTDLTEILDIWAPLVAQAFGATAEDLQSFVLYLTATPIANKLNFFVAFLHGVPAATTLLIVHADFVAMDWVGTKPTARKQGLGYAITCHALHTIKQSGAKNVLLLATNKSQSLYQKLGFSVVDWYNVYVAKTSR